MKKFRKAAFVLLSAVLVCAVAFGVCKAVSKCVDNYNKSFPNDYISGKYPNAKILGNEVTGDLIFNPYRNTYYCFDNELKFWFQQVFNDSGRFGTLVPDNEFNSFSYEKMLDYRSAFDNCISAVGESWKHEYTAAYAPNNYTGIVVFAGLDDIKYCDDLIFCLDNAIRDSEKTNDNYVEYTVCFCDEALYSDVKNFDYTSLYESEKYSNRGSIAQPGLELLEDINGKTYDYNDCVIVKYEDWDTAKYDGYDVVMTDGEPNAMLSEMRFVCHGK